MKTRVRKRLLKSRPLKVEGEEAFGLIETDVEVDLAPSIEHDEVIERIETLNRNDEEKKRNEREKKLAEAKEAVRLERKEERKEKCTVSKHGKETPVRTTFVHVIERSKNTNIFTDG